eukprot:gene8930-3814_t
MKSGEMGIECSDDGSINEQVLTQIALDVEEALQRGPSEVSNLMDRLVKCWGSGQGQTYRNSQAEDSAMGAVAREPFDFTATSYLTFVNEPEQFGWAKGSRQHKAAVLAMRCPLQEAFESETSGAWSEASDGFVLEDEADDGGGTSMSTRRFNTMLRECAAVLKVRQHRNQTAAHPLFTSVPNSRMEMFAMYRKVVAGRTSITRGFINLAKASIAHVEKELAKRAARDGVANVECLLEVVQL